MNDVNWWLMALAFLVGLVLTLALMIRRVKREVPVYGSSGGVTAAKGGGATAAAAGATGAAAGAGAAGAAAKLTDAPTAKTPAVTEEPYGAGSIRVPGTADAPSGYSVKGNEDSMLYHTAESPSFKQTIAEIWFRDVESAERAGFARWDSGKSQRGQR